MRNPESAEEDGSPPAGGPLPQDAPPPYTPAGEVTELLSAGRAGDRAAYDRVFALVYDHLRAAARAQLSREVRYREGGYTLSTTAVINEAWFRLADPARLDVQDRSHFLAIAARAMRHVLIEHARRFKAQKRGGGMVHFDLDAARLAGGELHVEERADVLVALDEALERLATLNPRLARVVECRYFGGLTEPETAGALGVNERTVRRDWVKARAWLHDEITRA